MVIGPSLDSLILTQVEFLIPYSMNLMCAITCPRPSGHQIMLSPFHLVNRCLDNTIYIIFICTLARRYPPKCLPSLVHPLALDQSLYTSVLRCSYFIITNSLDLHHFLRLHASVFNTCASQNKEHVAPHQLT